MPHWRLTPQNTALVVIDAQQRLLAAMPDRAQFLATIDRLIRSAKILDLPTLITLQYAKGLGPLCVELEESTKGIPQIEKMTFSCCGSEQFTRAIENFNRPNIILCGVETHVCVQQTALDLIAAGRAPYITADAVTSRHASDNDIAMEG